MRIVSKSNIKSFILLILLDTILIYSFVYVISISLNKKTFIDGIFSIIFIIGIIIHLLFKTFSFYKDLFCIIINEKEIQFNIPYNKKIKIENLKKCVLVKERKKERLCIKYKISSVVDEEFYIEKSDVLIKLKKLEKIIKGLMVK